MNNMLIVGALLLAFAVMVTAHVAIAVGLARRSPRWRAPVAFLLPPLAPYWAWQGQMKVRAGIWAGALVVYAVAIVMARA